MRRGRVSPSEKRTYAGPRTRFFLVAGYLVVLLMSFSACGLSNKPITWKPDFNILPPVTGSDKRAVFESNSEAGSVAGTSASFQMAKGTAGGSYQKLRSSSASFIMVGGAIHAP